MRKAIIYILVLTVFQLNAQRKRAADDAFNRFAYVKSAELYEEIYQRGDSSMLIISRLGDSYYFNSKTEASEKWYAKLLTDVEEDKIPSEYFFRYAQSLKSNGKYVESDSWLKKFQQMNETDSRGQKINTSANYLSELKDSDERYLDVTNLEINTEYSDFGIHIGRNYVYFASAKPFDGNQKKYSWNNQPFLNLYQGEEIVEVIEVDDEALSSIENIALAEGLQTPYHEAQAIVTKDGQTMYFTRDNFNIKRRKLKAGRDRTSHLKMYRATKIDSVWTNIEELPFNNDDYSVGHPSLSSDERELYFVSDMPGGFGATDIYKVKILKDSTFSKPQNLGKAVNTEGREMFPFVSADQTLFFSSDGHLGLGLLDVFSSKIDGDIYAGVENLGNPINSKKDDFAFVLNDKKSRGYFSSNRAGGKGDDDIYSFVYQEKKPKPCEQKISGVVVDKKFGIPLSNAKIELIKTSDGSLISELITGVSGRFSYYLPCNEQYIIKASKEYYKPDSNTFKTTAELELELDLDFDLGIIDAFAYNDRDELMIRIDPIFFNYNKSDIRDDAAIQLNKIVLNMNRYPKLIVQSTSHTDARGNARYNENLSERRAQSTVKYIVSNGIQSNRISGKGYGETKLTNGCVDNDTHSNRVKCTEAQHQANRRSEFIITNVQELGITTKVVHQTNREIIKENKGPQTHTVKRGETLYSIAKFYRLTVDELKRLNNLSGNEITVGQTLKIK